MGSQIGVSMKFKSKDIAKQLGVSPATISLVLNNKPGVSDAKRAEISQKITDMGYGHMLKTEPADKGTIGFIVFKCQGAIIDEFPFFSYLIEGININVKKHNYKMNIIYMNSSDSYEEQMHVIVNSGCIGFIVYAVEMFRENLNVFEQILYPCVYLDNSFVENDVDVVAIDNYLGVTQAIDYLYSKNHRRIGYIKSRVEVQSFIERYEAYTKIMKRNGLSVSEEDIMTVGYLEQETMKDVQSYIDKSKSLPTAFFADNDLLACRAVQILKENGYQVPEQVSVIGFDDRPICGFTEPKVSTIAIPRDIMGYIAVDRLVDKIEQDRNDSCKTLVGTKLIERDSVADLKEQD